jgi:hypothetical protein
MMLGRGTGTKTSPFLEPKNLRHKAYALKYRVKKLKVNQFLKCVPI